MPDLGKVYVEDVSVGRAALSRKQASGGRRSAMTRVPASSLREIRSRAV
jgi:hypothetical protein